MNKKERIKRRKKPFSLGRWIADRPLLIFVIVIVIVLFLFRLLYKTPEKQFTVWKNSDNKIVAYDLTEEEINKKIDWQNGAKLTHHYNYKNYLYCLKSKEENFFHFLIKKPTRYVFESNVPAQEIRNKPIEFEGHPEIKNITIPKTEFIIRGDHFFAQKSWSAETIIRIIYYIIGILLGLFMLDFWFGTNFMGALFSFRSRDVEVTDIPRIGFKDIGGLQEAKEELGEVIHYFRNPQIFWQRGATVPKGILLVGPPGNGKTLLAKALAGECGLPFLLRSGSDFEDSFVGLGARRVRELFRKARSYPQGCIIFIDEIDSIGRKRYSANNHTELTLNQLLNELDGFRPRDNIIIIAATNSINVLDKALLRPGRFDRQIYILPPNQKGRRQIIALCTRKILLHPNFDLEETVALTKGFSGAQIVNIFNEASILSIRYEKRAVDQEIIFEAYDRVLMGPSLTSETSTPTKKKLVAYHEAGHAIIGLSLPETNVRKITIIPRWLAGGYTWIDLRDDQGDDYLINKNQMLANIMSFLGGRASEELIFGGGMITTGAFSDFKSASEIVRDLILRYSMSDLGIIATQDSPLWGEESLSELSEAAKQKFENEREKILNQCWKKVRSILRQKKKVLSLLAEILLKKNSLRKDDIDFIFINQISPDLRLLN